MANRTGTSGFCKKRRESAREKFEGSTHGNILVKEQDLGGAPGRKPNFVRDGEDWRLVLALEHGKADEVEGKAEVFGQEKTRHDRAVGRSHDEAGFIRGTDFFCQCHDFG